MGADLGMYVRRPGAKHPKVHPPPARLLTRYDDCVADRRQINLETGFETTSQTIEATLRRRRRPRFQPSRPPTQLFKTDSRSTVRALVPLNIQPHSGVCDV